MRDRFFLSTALAASIAVAMGSTSAMAATAINQLPGQGRVAAGHVAVGNLASGAGTMELNVSGPAVINWGSGSARTDINPGGVGGFNIGSGAHVRFNGSGGAAVLNIDSSGNPSQILGALSAQGTDVYVANGNGIIVGAKARIDSSRTVGLIANRLLTGTASSFDGSEGTLNYSGSGGDVTVLGGAAFSGGGKVLIAGGGNVNVDLGAFAGEVVLRAGRASVRSGAADNSAATLTVSGQQRGTVRGFSSAGSATNLGTLSLTHATLPGTFTNKGTLSLANGFAMTGRLVNQKTLNANGNVVVGALGNSGSLTTRGMLEVDGPLGNNGHIVAPTYRGQLSVFGPLVNNGSIEGVSYVGVSRGDLTNNGLITLVNGSDFSGQVGTVAVEGGNLLNIGHIRSAVDSNHVARSSDLSLAVTNGSIDNRGTLADFGDIATGSDTNASNFNDHGDYSIVNSGLIRGNFTLDANYYSRAEDNHSTGSFSNTGVLDARNTGGGRSLSLNAQTNLDLGGKVLADGQTLGTGNALDGVSLTAANGKLTVATPLTFYANGSNSGAAYLTGAQVRIGANVTGLGADASIYVLAGHRSDGSYAYSVAPTAKLKAAQVYLQRR
jgi:filamentous hemagglutinin family protein